MRATACRAWSIAGGGRPGPVHVNLPLREPLAPVHEAGRGGLAGPARGAPWTVVRERPQAPDGDDVQALAARMAEAPRGAVVCGSGGGRVAEAVTRLAAQAGWPVLAEPFRRALRPARPEPRVAHYDVLLRDEGFAPGIARTWCYGWATLPPRSRCGPGSPAWTRW